MVERRPPAGVPTAVDPALLTFALGDVFGCRGIGGPRSRNSTDGSQAQIDGLEPRRQRIVEDDELPIAGHGHPEPHSDQRTFADLRHGLARVVTLVPALDLYPVVAGPHG